MSGTADNTPPTLRFVLPLLVACATVGPAPGQEFPSLLPDFSKRPLIPHQALLDLGTGGTKGERSDPRAARIPLFRMTTGYLYEPVGLETEGDPVADSAGSSGPSPDSFGDGRLGVVLGVDNPFFDFQAPGDPGGVGYYKVHTQYQLFDDQCTCLSVGFQAFTPAGLESDGLANGPTVVRPTVACSHAWDDGTAVHGFLGKPVMARPGWLERPERGLHYGLAFQSPLVTQTNCPGRGLHLFLEALGSYRHPLTTGQPSPVNWEFIPGLHWQVRDNWWFSSGVIVPVGSTRYDPGLLQINCSLKF